MCSRDVIQQIAEKVGPERRVLVAFSGGVDSAVLLHALVTLRREQYPELRLRAVYIHHGLSPYAQAWGDHCQAECDAWKVELNVVRVNVNPHASGIEAAAREARYQAISHLQADGEVLVTAQHLDDQCETFLLALKRGSGPTGLSSMPECTPFGVYKQIRPLINISRQQIEDYAKQNNLCWVEDDSNQDVRFDRNFLRLQVLPIIEQRWPHFSKMVSRSAKLCAEQESLLDEMLAPLLTELVFDDSSIDIEKLSVMSDVKRRALLRRWFGLQRAMMPSQDQLDKLWCEVALSKVDAEPVLLLGSHQVRRYQQRLYLLPAMKNLASVILEWQEESALILPDGLGQLSLAESGIAVRAPKDSEKVTVRFSAPGSLNVRMIGRNHSRSLKKLWQELEVAPWLRQRTPLLFYGETFIAAIGIFITAEGQSFPGQPVWFIQHNKT